MLRLAPLRRAAPTPLNRAAVYLRQSSTASPVADTKPYYVTTPIFYVNAAPHIGHLHSMVYADLFKKWHAWADPARPTFLTTGTDEHGMKVQHAANAAGVPTRPFVDAAAAKFQALASHADIAADRFIRTTDADHLRASQELWRKLQDNGYIYKGEHSGWYCVSDETFYPETQVERDPESGQMLAKETGKVVEWTSEENYFFALSKIQPQLLRFLQENEKFILPRSRYTQIVREVTEGLEDLSISRPKSRCNWGIPVPGDNSQVMYVWLDALTNYLTSAGFPDTPIEQSFWPANVHVIGKDIIRFHGIYWPAFLLAAQLPPPQQLVVHCHWTMLGSKMSKSLGNVVDPIEILDRYGIDSVKFFLANDSYLNHDSDYENERIVERHNNFLLNKYGNLVTRLCGPNFDLPRAVKSIDRMADLPETPLAREVDGLVKTVSANMENALTAPALSAVQDLVANANNFLATHEPWKLRQDPAAQDAIFRVAAEAARVASLVLVPFIPGIANRVLDRLAVAPEMRGIEHARYGADLTYGVGANRKGDHPVQALLLEDGTKSRGWAREEAAAAKEN